MEGPQGGVACVGEPCPVWHAGNVATTRTNGLAPWSAGSVCASGGRGEREAEECLRRSVQGSMCAGARQAGHRGVEESTAGQTDWFRVITAVYSGP